MWSHTFQGTITNICVDSTCLLPRKLSMFLLDDLQRDLLSTRTGISFCSEGTMQRKQEGKKEPKVLVMSVKR
ncbi:hypothetical protein GRJ2_001445900 [Grus japonensis]|uniref:Uncharacterized protein n=1 Tax=Grus japonensis TaxID=30415 RepID=A0ABC9WWM0_GRUJA